MNISIIPSILEEYKIQASILLKSLRLLESEKATLAAKRLSSLPEFSIFSPQEIIQQNIKLKHCLEVISREKGFKSWVDLKQNFQDHNNKNSEKFFINGSLNSWFANYAEAKKSHESIGGYLMPYKNHYFICEPAYISRLGFNPYAEEWEAIGYNWIVPKNIRAWERLYSLWINLKR